MKHLLLLIAISLPTGCNDNDNNSDNPDSASDSAPTDHADSGAIQDGRVFTAHDSLPRTGIVPMDSGSHEDAGTAPHGPLQDAARESKNPTADGGKAQGAGENCGYTTAGPQTYVACCPPGKDCTFLKRPTCDCVTERGWEGITKCVLYAGAGPDTQWPSVCE